MIFCLKKSKYSFLCFFILCYDSPPFMIYLCFSFSPPISDYDVFNEGKTQSFFESQQAVMALCTYLEGVNKNMEKLSKNQLFEHFNKLLQVSVFYTSPIHDNQASEVKGLICDLLSHLSSSMKPKQTLFAAECMLQLEVQ